MENFKQRSVSNEIELPEKKNLCPSWPIGLRKRQSSRRFDE